MARMTRGNSPSSGLLTGWFSALDCRSCSFAPCLQALPRLGVIPSVAFDWKCETHLGEVRCLGPLSPRRRCEFFVAAIVFARKPDALLNPQLFAEDGTIFFLGCVRGRPEGHFRHLRRDYLHLLPRLVRPGSRIPSIRKWIPTMIQ